jgi:hypothetical protein
LYGVITIDQARDRQGRPACIIAGAYLESATVPPQQAPMLLGMYCGCSRTRVSEAISLFDALIPNDCVTWRPRRGGLISCPPGIEYKPSSSIRTCHGAMVVNYTLRCPAAPLRTLSRVVPSCRLKNMDIDKRPKRNAFTAICLLLIPAIGLMWLLSSTPRNHSFRSLVIGAVMIAAIVGFSFAHRSERK